VHPVVFGLYKEVSAQCRDGGSHRQVGDAWAPQIADQYLLDNVLAAEGIAKSILREEIGAACFNAHAHIKPSPEEGQKQNISYFFITFF
jgi:hypothetical protein